MTRAKNLPRASIIPRPAAHRNALPANSPRNRAAAARSWDCGWRLSLPCTPQTFLPTSPRPTLPGPSREG
jgi:hypothetical protein